ncbi:hypothetical protein ACCO45_000694 [Purpureocillium lilacinum]|uniref:Uncharacterized protein n=1 Tax=Purpureocillium lilacinum TaxID=33203 RepID=A0ACC4E4W9_PURLI
MPWQEQDDSQEEAAGTPEASAHASTSPSRFASAKRSDKTDPRAHHSTTPPQPTVAAILTILCTISKPFSVSSANQAPALTSERNGTVRVRGRRRPQARQSSVFPITLFMLSSPPRPLCCRRLRRLHRPRPVTVVVAAAAVAARAAPAAGPPPPSLSPAHIKTGRPQVTDPRSKQVEAGRGLAGAQRHLSRAITTAAQGLLCNHVLVMDAAFSADRGQLAPSTWLWCIAESDELSCPAYVPGLAEADRETSATHPAPSAGTCHCLTSGLGRDEESRSRQRLCRRPSSRTLAGSLVARGQRKASKFGSTRRRRPRRPAADSDPVNQHLLASHPPMLVFRDWPGCIACAVNQPSSRPPRVIGVIGQPLTQGLSSKHGAPRSPGLLVRALAPEQGAARRVLRLALARAKKTRQPRGKQNSSKGPRSVDGGVTPYPAHSRSWRPEIRPAPSSTSAAAVSLLPSAAPLSVTKRSIIPYLT